jgi:hypothetical protein
MGSAYAGPISISRPKLTLGFTDGSVQEAIFQFTP